MHYYSSHIEALKDLFGAHQVVAEPHRLLVDERCYPILDDVIVLLDADQCPPDVRRRLQLGDGAAAAHTAFAEDIQYSFGAEWQLFSRILPEHETEFRSYFDLIDVDALAQSRVCDFGCGMGRWSSFLAKRCRELVLVDFSDAIFVARNNLRQATNALFFMGDVTKLPFREACADFGFCLGVLHHLPTPALQEVRALSRFSRRLLVYLYYALDNRPFHFQLLLRAITWCRRWLSGVRHHTFRVAFSWLATWMLYVPCIAFGYILRPFHWDRFVPLHQFYAGMSLGRIRQDAYDRFFTRIEQRVSRADIVRLADDFSRVVISNTPPYWHFVCER